MSRRTGFSLDTIGLILNRADDRCEVGRAGCTVAIDDIQHRRARGTGGTRRPNTNAASNGEVARW